MTTPYAPLNPIFNTGLDSGDNILTTLEDSVSEFYICMYDQINCLYDDTFRDDVYGKKTFRMDMLNSVNYLLYYLILIYKERKIDIDNGDDEGNNYYRSLYEIERVRDYFYCKGINIDCALELFNLTYFDDSDGQTQDGIGFMQIEGDGSTCPIFRIK